MKRRLFTAVLAEALTLPWSSWGAQLARAPRDVYDFFTVYDPAVGPYVCFYWFKDVNVVVLIEVQHYPTGITYYLERRQLSTEEAQQDVRFMTALLLGHAAKLKSTADFRLALKLLETQYPHAVLFDPSVYDGTGVPDTHSVNLLAPLLQQFPAAPPLR